MKVSWTRFIATAVLLGSYLVMDSLLPDQAHAIIIRHDTGYTRYYAREWDYPAVFPLGTNGFVHTCVASLVAPSWALTAAHCIQESGMSAALAADQDYTVTIAGMPVPVSGYVLHPAWQGGKTGRQQETDLALIQFHSPVEGVNPLPLYTGDAEADQTMLFLGWGYTGTGDHPRRSRDGQLRQAHNQVVAVTESWLQFNFDAPGQTSLSLPLEGVPGLGDSGGPALLGGKQARCLAGVAIGELGASSPSAWGHYGARVVYERISRQLDWINAVVGGSLETGQSCISSPD